MGNEVHRPSRFFGIPCPDLLLLRGRRWPNHRSANLEDGRFRGFASRAALTASVGRRAPGGSAVGMADIRDGDRIRVRWAAGAENAGDSARQMISSFD